MERVHSVIFVDQQKKPKFISAAEFKPGTCKESTICVVGDNDGETYVRNFAYWDGLVFEKSEKNKIITKRGNK